MNGYIFHLLMYSLALTTYNRIHRNFCMSNIEAGNVSSALSTAADFHCLRNKQTSSVATPTTAHQVVTVQSCAVFYRPHD